MVEHSMLQLDVLRCKVEVSNLQLDVLRCVFDDCNLQLDVLHCVFDDDLAQPLCFAMVIFRTCNTSHTKRTNMNRPRLAVDNLQKKSQNICVLSSKVEWDELAPRRERSDPYQVLCLCTKMKWQKSAAERDAATEVSTPDKPEEKQLPSS